jgi:hypothetical protein
LRVLRHYHGHAYPLESLAANLALGRLTHLLCHPHQHARQDPHQGRGPAAISHAGVHAVVTSPHLSSLTHLQMRCCDGGDDMVADIVASSAMKRLKVLDLRHGLVTDVGARHLAECPTAKSLELLDLVNNRLTNTGITALQAAGVRAGVRVRAEEQQTRPYDYHDIFQGDTE